MTGFSFSFEKENKKITIEFIGKEFYCIYCKEYNRKCSKEHRSGIWYLIKISLKNEKIVNEHYFIIGEGEGEIIPFNIDLGELKRTGMSGCSTYERGHFTKSGWLKLFTPVEITEEEFKKINKEIEHKNRYLNTFEEIHFVKTLNKHIKDILFKIYNKNPEILKYPWGPYEDIKPLIITYSNFKEFKIDNAKYIWYEDSFKAKFKYGKIEFETIKANPKVEKMADYTILFIGKKKIYFSELYGRKIVYYEIQPNRLIGYEEYKGILHQPCIIKNYNKPALGGLLESPIKYYTYISILFTNRLGDVILLDEKYEGHKEIIEYFKLEKATEEEFKKIQCLKGEIIKTEEGIKVKGKEITLYHPEHGILEKIYDEEEIEYTAYKVPYITRGHE